MSFLFLVVTFSGFVLFFRMFLCAFERSFFSGLQFF